MKWPHGRETKAPKEVVTEIQNMLSANRPKGDIIQAISTMTSPPVTTATMEEWLKAIQEDKDNVPDADIEFDEHNDDDAILPSDSVSVVPQHRANMELPPLQVCVIICLCYFVTVSIRIP